MSSYRVLPPTRHSHRTSPFHPAGGGRGVSDPGAAEDRDKKEGAGEEGAGPAEAHQGRRHHHGAPARREARFQEEAPPETGDGEAGMLSDARRPFTSRRGRHHNCGTFFIFTIAKGDIKEAFNIQHVFLVMILKHFIFFIFVSKYLLNL